MFGLLPLPVFRPYRLQKMFDRQNLKEPRSDENPYAATTQPLVAHEDVQKDELDKFFLKSTRCSLIGRLLGAVLTPISLGRRTYVLFFGMLTMAILFTSLFALLKLALDKRDLLRQRNHLEKLREQYLENEVVRRSNDRLQRRKVVRSLLAATPATLYIGVLIWLRLYYMDNPVVVGIGGLLIFCAYSWALSLLSDLAFWAPLIRFEVKE